MGRAVKRVPLDFDFPLDASYADHCCRKVLVVHEKTCALEEHDGCEVNCDWEPPKGPGWQLWQTVSDGPITPVFATADELIDYMCQPVPPAERRPYAPEAYPKMPAGKGWRREVAEPFVRGEMSAPSFVGRPGRHGTEIVNGPNAVVASKRGRE